MYCKVYSLAVCLCHEMIEPPLPGATIFLVMKTKTKLKHFFLLASLCLVAMACGGHLARPVSGLDVSLLATQLLSISPKAAVDEAAEQEATPAAETKTPVPATDANKQQ